MTTGDHVGGGGGGEGGGGGGTPVGEVLECELPYTLYII